MNIHKFLIHRNDVRYPNDAITFFNDKPEIGMIAKFLAHSRCPKYID